MENVCQSKYLHSVPKEDLAETVDSEGYTQGRINLTFRCKDYNDGNTAGELEHERRDQWMNDIQTEGGNMDVMASGWKVDDRLEEQGVVFGDDIQYYDPELHNNVKVEYVVRTNIGAECYCAAELQEALDIERYKMLARPFGVAGYVAVCIVNGSVSPCGEEDASQMQYTLLQLRTAHHILRYHDHFELDDVVLFHTTEQDSAELTKKSIDGEMLYQYYMDRLVKKVGCVQSLVDLESGSFRVSCDRVGNHNFQAPEVERYVIVIL